MAPSILVLLALMCLVASVIALLTAVSQSKAQALRGQAAIAQILEVLAQEKAKAAKDREYLEWLQDHVARGVQLLAIGYSPADEDGCNGNNDRDNGHGNRDFGRLH